MNKHPNLELEYTQINNNFRSLAEVRFKLLALLPTLGGAGVFVLARAALEAGNAIASSNSLLIVVLLVSLLGFLATLGITLYDQRNSELYNALIHRAKYLETQFGVPRAPGGLREVSSGGQFSERPNKSRHLIFQAGHDLALALIYGPLLGAWLFLVLYSTLLLVGSGNQSAQLAATGAAAIAALLFTKHLIALDKHEMELYKIAANRDGLEEKETQLDNKRTT